jgi:hypothetical protein
LREWRPPSMETFTEFETLVLNMGAARDGFGANP